MASEISRRLRGRVRQSRKILYSEVNTQIDLALDLIRTNLVSNEFLNKPTDSFQLLILASTTDLPLAIRNVENMKRLYGSRISKITVVTEEYPEFEISQEIQILTDGDLLQNRKVVDCLKQFGLRASWMCQQYFKSLIVHCAELPVLILDADTFLVNRLAWLSEGNQLLLINPADYHTPYTTHASSYFGFQAPALNFVMHVQLQDPNIVREIYTSDFDAGWIRWAEASKKFGEDSPASEFQTYGVFLTSRHPDTARLFIPNHQICNGEQISLNNFVAQIEDLKCDLVTVGNKNKMKLQD